jgi:hypothetical protein
MTDKQTLRRSAAPIALAAAMVGSLALAACQPSNSQTAVSAAPPPLAAIPLATSGAPTIAPAPAADALPPAPAASVGQLANPSDQYAFAEQAYAMTSAFGDAPPDYSFDYGDGQQPWVWRGDDQSMRVAEALPGGGYRYYYYERSAQTPYLVRDPDYSYGYDNGVLVVVYDSQGRALSDDNLARRADIAGRFLARAEALYAASQRDQREAVAQANWAARRSEIDSERAQWAADQAADADWRAYHALHEQQEVAQWDAERVRREAEAARFAQSINDTQLATRDWQAAQRAQTRVTQSPATQSPRPGIFGLGPKGPPAPPSSQPLAQVQSSVRPTGAPNGTGQPPRGFPPASGQPTVAFRQQVSPPGSAANAGLQAEALRRGQTEAAVRQAQLGAQRQAQLTAQAAAANQAQAARLAATRQTAVVQSQALRQTQAARQAQLSIQVAARAKLNARPVTPTVVTVAHPPVVTKVTPPPPPPPKTKSQIQGAQSGLHNTVTGNR